MKILILCPGRIPKTVNEIYCFTDVINYYLPAELLKVSDSTAIVIPTEDSDSLRDLFSNIKVDDFDVILTLGLRFYSRIPKETTGLLRSRFKGLFCQTYDGSRLDYDPVDITFTFKNDDERMSANDGWFRRHKLYNEYMGWAADPEMNTPMQDPNNLRILVDHTNYGDGSLDITKEVLTEIKKLVDSNIWRTNYKNIIVRRFDSGKIVDVDLNNIYYQKYDRKITMPFSEISREHCYSHIFCVTHPESVGLVVLETAMAGAFIVTPEKFIPKDRLKTVRHYEWKDSIDWNLVLNSIDIEKSRNVALANSWKNMATNIIEVLSRRLGNGSN